MKMILAAAGVLMACPAMAQFTVVDPADAVLGKTQAEWSVEWWKHMITIPDSVNPITDTTGENAFRGDAGRVFFLAGTFGGSASRHVTVRDDQYLFFPLLSAIYTQGDPAIDTEDFMRGELAAVIDAAGSLMLSSNRDGFGVPTNHRQASPRGLFDARVEEGNILGNPAGSYPAVSDGFWVMLEPLQRGTYELEFGGDIPGVFSTSVTYTIEVVPGPGAIGLMGVVGLVGGRRRR